MYKFGKLTSLRRDEISIRYNIKVIEYGEVFTPSNIVNDMLDLLPTKDDGRTLILDEKTKAEKSYISSTFLDPSCGDGNFLVEILNRKLKCVSESSFDHDVLLAISSIYGVDIQADNVLESRRRMLGVLEDFYGDRPISEEQLDKINEILFRNIILGNTLTGKMIYLSNTGEALKEDGTSEGVYFVESDGRRVDTMNRLTLDNQMYVYELKCAEYNSDLTYKMVKLLEDNNKEDEHIKVTETNEDMIARFKNLSFK